MSKLAIPRQVTETMAEGGVERKHRTKEKLKIPPKTKRSSIPSKTGNSMESRKGSQKGEVEETKLTFRPLNGECEPSASQSTKEQGISKQKKENRKKGAVGVSLSITQEPSLETNYEGEHRGA